MVIDANDIKHINTRLRYRHEENWLSLPTWCRHYIDLGIEVARLPQMETRLRVALALPTSAFATLFVALGIVLELANQPNTSKDYSEYIRSQPVGTSVVYQSPQGRLKGIIEGFLERDGKTYIEIRLGVHSSLQLPLLDRASRITIADRDFKLKDYPRSGKVPSIPELIRASVSDPTAFITQTQLHCLIVTQISELRSEVESTILGLEVQGKIVSGPALDILRIEQFVGIDQPYRCRVVASYGSAETDVLPEPVSPPITILVGANSYLKHYAKWHNSHQIILLDRTERAFQAAVDSLNESYGHRRDKSLIVPSFYLPLGVDAMVFEESI
ncbi:hypothetical protein ANRL4_03774 [Anaerolineae bacterium]|nr:hypothetical protein ANRL4_03774 [Anaerolineae bacterium]